MELGLKGKAALVCGSSQGLGRAIAEALAGEGADVVVNSRSAAKVDAVAAEIAKATGAKVVGAAGDLTDPAAVESVVTAARNTLGRIDILVTNTGGPPSGPFEDHDAEAWRHAIAQNLESVVNLVRLVLPEMKERRSGRILNVTSISVKQPVAGLILSNSIRAAVTGFAKTLSNEVAPFNVTVNCIIPGYTRTERLVDLAEANAGRTGETIEAIYERWAQEVPLGRLGEPKELAAMAAFLCSEKASYVTGQSVAVDGGWIRSLF
jgi:3-oxoacyl-[acyl-carrier protein] reductase